MQKPEHLPTRDGSARIHLPGPAARHSQDTIGQTG